MVASHLGDRNRRPGCVSRLCGATDMICLQGGSKHPGRGAVISGADSEGASAIGVSRSYISRASAGVHRGMQFRRSS